MAYRTKIRVHVAWLYQSNQEKTSSLQARITHLAKISRPSHQVPGELITCLILYSKLILISVYGLQINRLPTPSQAQ